MGSYNSGMGVFSTLITVGSLLMGAWLMMKGELSAADLVTFLLYINNFTEPVKRLVNFTEQFQNGYSGYERFLEIMSIAPDIKDKEDAQSLDRVKGEIQFEDVSFHYSENKENVLSHVNLDVKPGEYVALVGSSGAGKTTLCSLIPRFYDVTGGAVLLDGIDIRDVKLKDLRRQIGIVQQDVYLFAGTILENIRYGKLDATREEIVKASRTVCADEFISKMPDRYQTEVRERGSMLSQGQKQLISFARTLLSDPAILILDEATSSIDVQTEKALQTGLNAMLKGRTSFIIAHRLSTIRNCDKIMYIDNGGIMESGTHDELMVKKGYYYKLYTAQLDEVQKAG